MKPLFAGVLILSALALTGCAVPSGTVEEEAPAPDSVNIPVEEPHSAYLTKPIVEGTELLCLSRGNYGSTSCNWELWNKVRENR
ncbi:hypothetical protein [Arthrobacter sp. UYCo732]|uniref:hypothetical protein n=1 Tax=Arthrobacter sp. UYCo732 TaxID=3156336 RepID=UPI003398DC27